MSVPTTDRGGIQQTIRALIADGWSLVFVDDGGENVPVKNEREAVDAIMSVDDSRLFVRRTAEGPGGARGWVRFVLGNAPDEVVCDYTTNLTAVDVLTESWF